MDVCCAKPCRKSANGEIPEAAPVNTKVPRALAALVTLYSSRRKSPPQVHACLPRVKVIESLRVKVWLVRKAGVRSCRLLKAGAKFSTGSPQSVGAGDTPVMPSAASMLLTFVNWLVVLLELRL